LEKKWKRDRARKLASDLGIDSVVVFVNIPAEIARERWIKNRQMNERFDLPEDVFEEAVREFEIPTEEENLLVYDQSIPVEQWVEENLTK
jgi:thymidylate kinase